jgi:hypothetical protein
MRLLSTLVALTAAAPLLESPAFAQGAPNVVPIVMGAPPHAKPGMGLNHLLVSVTVCPPGQSTDCPTVDDVMIDTGSVGLRLQASALPAGFADKLPVVRTSYGHQVAECLNFSSSQAWGGLHVADVSIGGSPLWASGLKIQVVGDIDRPVNACNQVGAAPTSNGTLGVGVRSSDCTGNCDHASPPLFYKKEHGVWSPYTGSVPNDLRLPNPILRLPPYRGVRFNNGFIIDLPSTPEHAPVLNGTLTFGIDTVTNNRGTFANLVKLDDQGHFTTVYGSVTPPTAGEIYAKSYFDTGTDQYEFNCSAGSLQPCPAGSRYGLSTQQSQTAVLYGASSVDAAGNPLQHASGASVAFKIGKRDVTFDQALGTGVGVDAGLGVADDVAFASKPPVPPRSGSFVWGAPFFIGKRVSVLIADQSARATADPDAPSKALVGPAYGFVLHRSR